MKQLNTFKKFATMALLLCSGVAGAQWSGHPLSYGVLTTGGKSNWYKDYVGLQFAVTAPSAVAGDKIYTFAFNDSWGGNVTSSIIDAQVVEPQAGDSCACGAITTDMSGKIAIIYRGPISDPCEFGSKAHNAQSAGAIACVIVNDMDGGPVGMGAGSEGSSVTIPVFMISKADGDAIYAQLNAGTTVTMSITAWGVSATHDLGIIDNGGALWHDYAIPYSQLGADNGNPFPYKQLDGAFIANYGSSTETNVKLDANVKFTPTEGGTTTVMTDSTHFSSFPVADSVYALYTSNPFDIHATEPGRFDISYSLSSDATDDFPSNNTASYSFYATNNIFSKGRYDFANHKPISTIYEGPTSGSVTWGPMYYFAKGGTRLDSLQFSFATTAGGVFPTLSTFNFYIFKWVDGYIDSIAGIEYPKDGKINEGELILVGQNSYTADGVVDSSEEIFSLPVVATDGVSSVYADDTSWYWIATQVDNGFFLACDGIMDDFPRSYGIYHYGIASLGGDSSYVEPYSPTFPDAETAMTFDGTYFSSFPFDRVEPDSVNYGNQKGLVASIPLIVTPPLGVQKVNGQPLNVSLYPNPSTDQVIVSLSLDKPAKSVTYVVADGMARMMDKEVHTNVQNDKLELSTTRYPAGVYYVSIIADGKSITKKFVVVK